MTDARPPTQISNSKRAGIALVTVIACAAVASYANEPDVAVVGAIAGGAAAGLPRVIYGPPPSGDRVSRRSMISALVAGLVGLVLEPTIARMGSAPPAAILAASAAMVLAGASELIKGSGLAASFDALMATGIVAVLSIFFAVGIGQYAVYPALIGGAVGLFATLIGASPFSAVVGLTVGQTLRIGFNAIVPAATSWLRLL